MNNTLEYFKLHFKRIQQFCSMLPRQLASALLHSVLFYYKSCINVRRSGWPCNRSIPFYSRIWKLNVELWIGNALPLHKFQIVKLHLPKSCTTNNLKLINFVHLQHVDVL